MQNEAQRLNKNKQSLATGKIYGLPGRNEIVQGTFRHQMRFPGIPG